MPLSEEQENMKALMTEAITILCKNGLNYRGGFTIEGLLAITLDSQDVFVVNINEQVKKDITSSLHHEVKGISRNQEQRHQSKVWKHPFLGGNKRKMEGKISAKYKVGKKQKSSARSSEVTTTKGKSRTGKRARPHPGNRLETVALVN